MDDLQTYSIGVDENETGYSEERLRENYNCVHDVYDALHDADFNIEQTAVSLLLLLRTGSWERFRANNNRIYEYRYFGDFAVAPVSAGLNTTPDRLRVLARGNADCVGLLEEALRREGGAPEGNQNARKEKTTVDNVHGCFGGAAGAERPTGNSRAATIRQITRLARNAADPRAAEAQLLLDQVYADRVSANAAAIRLGLRQKAVTFNLATLSDEVQQELQRLRDEEDWSTGEIIEEAMRAFFRLVREEDAAPASAPPRAPASAPSPAPTSNGHKRVKRSHSGPLSYEEAREAVLKLEAGQRTSGRCVHVLTGQKRTVPAFVSMIAARSDGGEDVIVSGNGWSFRKKPRVEMDAEGLHERAPSWEVLERGN